MLKKIAYGFVFLLIIFTATSFVNNKWIDKTDRNSFPNEKLIYLSRIVWQFTPSFSLKNEANRALKLSWLTVTTSIYKKDKKTIATILTPLQKESEYLSGYLLRNLEELDSATKSRIVIQLLLYLNRVELYENFSMPMLELKLQEFDSWINHEDDLVLKEDWLWEKMIRFSLKGETENYKTSRSQLIKIIQQNHTELPPIFLNGVVALYDGVLACIAKQSDQAASPLSIATVNLRMYPEYTTNLLNRDLNVLLLGRGMEAGQMCRDAINNIISGDK